MESSDLIRRASLVYPVMLAQEAGEISEAKAAEMLGLDIVTYREQKAAAATAVRNLAVTMPTPLSIWMLSRSAAGEEGGDRATR